MRLPPDHQKAARPAARAVSLYSGTPEPKAVTPERRPEVPQEQASTPDSHHSNNSADDDDYHNMPIPERDQAHSRFNSASHFSALVAQKTHEAATFQPIPEEEEGDDDDFDLEELERAAVDNSFEADPVDGGDADKEEEEIFSDPGMSDPGLSDFGAEDPEMQYISESSEDGEVERIVSPNDNNYNDDDGVEGGNTNQISSAQAAASEPQQQNAETMERPPMPQSSQQQPQMRVTVTNHETNSLSLNHGTATPVASNLGEGFKTAKTTISRQDPIKEGEEKDQFKDSTPVVANGRKSYGSPGFPLHQQQQQRQQTGTEPNHGDMMLETHESRSDWSKSAVDQVTSAVGHLARLGETFLSNPPALSDPTIQRKQPPLPMKRRVEMKKRERKAKSRHPRGPGSNDGASSDGGLTSSSFASKSFEQGSDAQRTQPIGPSSSAASQSDHLAGALDRMNLEETATKSEDGADSALVYSNGDNVYPQPPPANSQQPHLHPQLLQQHQEQFNYPDQQQIRQYPSFPPNQDQAQVWSPSLIQSRPALQNAAPYSHNMETTAVPQLQQKQSHDTGSKAGAAKAPSTVSGSSNAEDTSPMMRMRSGGHRPTKTDRPTQRREDVSNPDRPTKKRDETRKPDRPKKRDEDRRPDRPKKRDGANRKRYDDDDRSHKMASSYAIPRTSSEEQSQSLKSARTETTESVYSQSMQSQSMQSQSMQSQSIQSQATGMTEEEFHAMKQRKWREKKKIVERSRAREREKLDGSGRRKKRRGGRGRDMFGGSQFGEACTSGLENIITAFLSGGCGHNLDSESEGDEESTIMNDQSTHGSEEDQTASFHAASFTTPLTETASHDLTENSNLVHGTSAASRTDTSAFGSKIIVDKMKDKSFIREFIADLSTAGIKMLLHRQANRQAKNQLAQPYRVAVRLSLGGRAPNGTFEEPHLKIWTESHDVLLAFDIFDVRAIEKASVMKLKSYPLALPGNCFLIRLADTDHVFEAPDEECAARFVHGMRWLIARLSFNLIIGNPTVSCELLETIEASPYEMQKERAMNDIANHMAEKTIVSVAPE